MHTYTEKEFSDMEREAFNLVDKDITRLYGEWLLLDIFTEIPRRVVDC